VHWRYKWRSLWNRELQRDLDDELNAHVEMRAAELIAAGMTPAEAAAEARRRFGNLTNSRENTRDVHIFTLIEGIFQDLRYAARVLRRQPMFTFAAALTLALVIGANGAIVSLLETVLLRPLPFDRPGELVLLYGADRAARRTAISAPDLEDWRLAKSFSDIAAMQGQSVALTGVDEPTRLVGGFVSANYFRMLGVRPALGRDFVQAEDRPGAAHVCLLTHAAWQTRFGGAPDTLGRVLILNSEPFTVVGILPADFRSVLIPADVWLPIQNHPSYSTDRARMSVVAMGRLSARATVDNARAELTTIARRLALQFPGTNHDRGALVLPAQEAIVEDLKPTLYLLAIGVGCVLLIGCANVAGLLLSKAVGRRQEMAVRASLGAGQGRLMRQLLTESMLLALAGGLLGIALAYGLIKIVASLAGDLTVFARNNHLEVRLDLPVVLFLVALSVAAGLLFGVAPAFIARKQPASAMRQRGAGLRQGHLRSALVISQVALALILLVGAGLTIKSLHALVNMDAGFKADRILTLEYRLPRNKYPAPAQQSWFHHEVVSRIAALPGVEAAGMARALPFSGDRASVNITLPDRPEPPRESPFRVQYNAVTPDYFATLNIPLLEGRRFTMSDGPQSLRVVLVSQSFANRFWPGHEVAGKQVRIPTSDAVGAPAHIATIIGVTGNIRREALDEGELPQIYAPYAQDPSTFAMLAVRTKGDPLAAARDVSRAVWSIDKDQPVWKVATLESLMQSATASRRYVVFLLGCFSAIALFLAAVGLYGVLAYGVSQRTSEFGIRLAVGAEPFRILTLVLQRGMSLAVTGVALGIAGALALMRFLESQLYHVAATDPQVYAGLSALLLSISFIAMLVPARRAMRIDPVIALREE